MPTPTILQILTLHKIKVKLKIYYSDPSRSSRAVVITRGKGVKMVDKKKGFITPS